MSSKSGEVILHEICTFVQDYFEGHKSQVAGVVLACTVGFVSYIVYKKLSKRDTPPASQDKDKSLQVPKRQNQNSLFTCKESLVIEKANFKESKKTIQRWMNTPLLEELGIDLSRIQEPGRTSNMRQRPENHSYSTKKKELKRTISKVKFSRHRKFG